MDFEPFTVDDLDLSDARLDGLRLRSIRAERATLDGSVLTEVVVDGIDCPDVDAVRTGWTNVEVTGRLGAVDAHQSGLRQVHFVGCKLGFVNLRAATLRDVVFTDCIIENLDLGGATVQRVGFESTRIHELDVNRARLVDLDLRGAALAVIGGLGSLRGATITAEQLALLAPHLAAHLGITVEE